jgi:predicted DCC family thiol-disulfide oxidoreductase YuxK
MPSARQAYSYRTDASVPAFPDDKPIIVFDGHCAVCSGWAQFVIRHDPNARYRLLAAQTPLAASLFTHYGLDPLDYESNILIADGNAWFKSEGTIRMWEGLGWPLLVMGVLRVLPRAVRDRGYDVLARNRFRWFGRREVCFAPAPDIAARFLS